MVFAIEGDAKAKSSLVIHDVFRSGGLKDDGKIQLLMIWPSKFFVNLKLTLELKK